MSYVYGLGDAQEDEARRFEMKYGWIHKLEIECPNCGNHEGVDVEGWETEYDEYYEVWTLDCFCNGGCGHQFYHSHWIWYK